MKKKKELQKITKIRSFIDKNNWEGIIYPWKKKIKQNKKIEKNDLTIALNVLYAKAEKNITCPCFKT